MIAIDPLNQTERENYKLLIGSIIPRPIAFVTSLSAEGVLNAAPFSYFTIVTADSPMVAVSIQRRQGKLKDTSRNAMDIGEFVVHISDESYINQINQAAAALPPDQSEVMMTGLTPVESTKVTVPGLAEANIRMECMLEQAIPLGGTEGVPSADLLIGRVVQFHIADALYENGHIDAQGLRPVTRLAGNFYAKLGEQFTLERPV